MRASKKTERAQTRVNVHAKAMQGRTRQRMRECMDLAWDVWEREKARRGAIDLYVAGGKMPIRSEKKKN